MLDLNSGTPWETVHLTTLSRDRNLFSSLLAEARQLAQQAQVGRTVIYTAWGAEWRPFGRPREKRLLESVVLDKGVKERVVDDVKAFMGRGKWYSERGERRRRPPYVRFRHVKLMTTFLSRRHPVPTRLPLAWTARLGQIFLHPSARRFPRLQHLRPQLVRARLDGRQAQPLARERA